MTVTSDVGGVSVVSGVGDRGVVGGGGASVVSGVGGGGVVGAGGGGVVVGAAGGEHKDLTGASSKHITTDGMCQIW